MSVPGECVHSWSVCGTLCLSFPLPVGKAEEGRGWVQPLALTFGLLSLALGHQWGCWSSNTVDALALYSWYVPHEQPSPQWGGLYCGCTVCHVWVCECTLCDPQLCPWSAPGYPADP